MVQSIPKRRAPNVTNQFVFTFLYEHETKQVMHFIPCKRYVKPATNVYCNVYINMYIECSI